MAPALWAVVEALDGSVTGLGDIPTAGSELPKVGCEIRVAAPPEFLSEQGETQHKSASGNSYQHGDANVT